MEVCYYMDGYSYTRRTFQHRSNPVHRASHYSVAHSHLDKASPSREKYCFRKGHNNITLMLNDSAALA